MITTYSIREATEIVGAPSERWLIEQLRSGRFPGRKIGRHWRMTERDIENALNLCRNTHRDNVLESATRLTGLTPDSKRRVAKVRLVSEPPFA